jgi:hypothetical protein
MPSLACQALPSFTQLVSCTCITWFTKTLLLELPTALSSRSVCNQPLHEVVTHSSGAGSGSSNCQSSAWSQLQGARSVVTLLQGYITTTCQDSHANSCVLLLQSEPGSTRSVLVSHILVNKANASVLDTAEEELKKGVCAGADGSC